MTHKLLLADDSVTIQRVIELTFAGEDVQVVTASDGEQAIAKVQAERPDIVLADIGMPKRSGYEVAAFIKGEPGLAHIPVLLLTGAFEPVDEGRAQAAGCDGVLVKPFEPQHVIARVRELLHGAKGSPRQAVADVPRPAARLAPHRPVELPHRDTREESAAGVDAGAFAEAFGPGGKRAAAVEAPQEAEGGRAVPDDSLDDYFDRLDAAFTNVGTEPAAEPPTRVHEPEVMPRHEGVVVEKDLDVFDAPRTVEGAATGHDAPAVIEQPALEAPPPKPAPAQLAAPEADTSWMESFEPPVTLEPPSRPGAHTVPLPPPVEPPDASPTLSPQSAPPIASEAPVPPTASRSASSRQEPLLADAFEAFLAAEEGEPGAEPVRFAVPSSPPVLTDELIDDITSRVMQQLGPGAVRDVVADIVSKVAERLVREEIDRIRKQHS